MKPFFRNPAVTIWPSTHTMALLAVPTSRFPPCVGWTVGQKWARCPEPPSSILGRDCSEWCSRRPLVVPLIGDSAELGKRLLKLTLAAGAIKPIRLPARTPNLTAYVERWVRSVKEECLSKLILFGEASLRRALTEFIDHFHGERNHPGKGNVLLFPAGKVGQQKARTRGALPRAPWRIAEVLQLCRMNIFTKRHHRATETRGGQFRVGD